MTRNDLPATAFSKHRTGSNDKAADTTDINAGGKLACAIAQWGMRLSKIVMLPAGRGQYITVVRPVTVLCHQPGKRGDPIGSSGVSVSINDDETFATNRRDRVRILIPPTPNLVEIIRRKRLPAADIRWLIPTPCFVVVDGPRWQH